MQRIGREPVLTIDVSASTLLMIDFQARLMPAMDDAATAIAIRKRVAKLDQPCLETNFKLRKCPIALCKNCKITFSEALRIF